MTPRDQIIDAIICGGLILFWLFVYSFAVWN